MPKPKLSKLKRVQCMLQDDQIEWLDSLAEKYGQDRSGYLRLLIQDIRRNDGKMPSEVAAELTVNFQKRLDEIDDLRRRIEKIEKKG